MRGQGRVYRPKVRRPFDPAHEHFKSCGPKGCYFETDVWWLDYSIDGKRHQESASTTSKKEALRLLDQRRGDRRDGKIVGTPDRVTLKDLTKLVAQRYVNDGRRSLVRVQRALNHIERIFGGETRAMAVTGTRLDDYTERRLGEGAARATVNYELAALRRGFRLAVKNKLLAVMPVFELPKVQNARRGFFEAGDFAALLVELPEYLRPVIQFARYTGWRVHKEILPLMWEAVDWEGRVIRLHGSQTKGGESRLFPFAQAPELRELLEAQWKARDGAFVFHRHGRRIKDFRTAWENACVRAGLGTRDPETKKVTLSRIPHDLRRSAARDLRRAGVSEGEIMQLCGWRTRSMFDRYNVIDEQDLANSVAKRFANGKQAGNIPAAAAPAE